MEKIYYHLARRRKARRGADPNRQKEGVKNF